MANVLITGASGYLGSSFIHALGDAHLPAGVTIYASVRSAAHAKAVTEAGLTPWVADIFDPAAIAAEVVDKQISVVFWLVDALKCDAQVAFIKALAEVKKTTGSEVHFLHTSGSKIFSDLAGAPTDKPLLDTAKDLYDTQKAQKAPYPLAQEAVATNNTVIELGEALGVRTYIFVPCIVYGKHEGFGNPISIQSAAIVKAAKAAGQVYKVDNDRPTWPVCHVDDNTRLYTALLTKILSSPSTVPHGKAGYFLAASGSVAWDDLYASMAVALAKRGVVASAEVLPADDAALERMATQLEGPKELVRLQLGGNCTFTAARGAEIGWHPRYAPEHIFESADEEVERILKHI